MSQWTHVVGAIRIDGVGPFTEDHIKELRDVIGPVSTFDSPKPTSLPCGTEGSLEYIVHQYCDADSNGFPWVVVPIWGDLRDYNTSKPIIGWFESLMPKLEDRWLVRDAVLKIEVEGEEPVVVQR